MPGNGLFDDPTMSMSIAKGDFHFFLWMTPSDPHSDILQKSVGTCQQKRDLKYLR